MRRSLLGPLLFFAYPVAEIMLTLWVASVIGWGWTIVLELGVFLIGFAVMRIAGLTAFKALTEQMPNAQTFEQLDPETGERVVIHPNHEMSPEDIATATKQLRSSGLLFAGGALLALPGLITDVFGLLLILPPIRAVIASRMADRADTQGGSVVQGETVEMDEHGVHAKTWGTGASGTRPAPNGRGDVIQGQILPPKPREPEDR